MRPSEFNARRKLRFGQATLLRITFVKVKSERFVDGWYAKIPSHLFDDDVDRVLQLPRLTLGPYRSKALAVEEALTRLGVIKEGEG